MFLIIAFAYTTITEAHLSFIAKPYYYYARGKLRISCVSEEIPEVSIVVFLSTSPL